MMIAFNQLTKDEEDLYRGKSFTMTFSWDSIPFVHEGVIVDFNDYGIVLEWKTIDPLGFCVDTQTYANVRGSINDLTIE